MEEVFLRFPHLSENIFQLLNSESLAKSKEVSKSWYHYLDDQKFLQTRAKKVKLVIETVEKLGLIQHHPFKNTFDLHTKKVIINNARNGNFDFVHAKIMNNIDLSGIGSLWVATKDGHFDNLMSKVLDVVKYIMDQIEEKNPKDNKGKTPLHYAANYGYVTVFKYIVETVDEKNPTDNDGNTPLDLARHKGFLELFKCM